MVAILPFPRVYRTSIQRNHVQIGVLILYPEHQAFDATRECLSAFQAQKQWERKNVETSCERARIWDSSCPFLIHFIFGRVCVIIFRLLLPKATFTRDRTGTVPTGPTKKQVEKQQIQFYMEPFGTGPAVYREPFRGLKPVRSGSKWIQKQSSKEANPVLDSF